MTTFATDTPADSYHRRRRAEKDGEINLAARRVLDEKGYAGFTTEAVAARSGIAKTTIYRRYERAIAVAADALGADPVILEHMIDELHATALEMADELPAYGLHAGTTAAILMALVIDRAEPHVRS